MELGEKKTSKLVLKKKKKERAAKRKSRISLPSNDMENVDSK